MTLITLPNRPVPGGAEDISQVMADFDAIVAVVNGNLDDSNIALAAAIKRAKLDFGGGLVDADISPTAAIQLSKLATIPGVMVATKVSDLGAGSDGRQALIRLMPTTYNAGGATVLPAATITVGDTTDFPTSATVTTPNGTLTYTGKTATTLTGVTGGAGTLAANAVITLASGTPASGSYDYVALTYDGVAAKWLSDVSSFFVDNWGANIASLNTWSTFSQTAMGAWSWRALDAAGLKPQVRMAGGFITAGAAGTSQIRPAFASAAKRVLGPAPTLIGADANAANAVGTVGTVARTLEATPWGTIPAYTVADIFYPSMQGQQVSGSPSSHNIFGNGEVRWVG
jgi:hypothetical protein